MFSSYSIFPSLTYKIQQSWLLEKFPELLERPYGSIIFLDELLLDTEENILDVSLNIQNSIYRIISQPYPWLIEENIKEDEGGNLFWKTEKKIPPDETDIWIWTWLFLPCGEEGIHLELQKFSQYGFDSTLQMILSLSAYRFREILAMKTQEYSWINSKGIKNVITACEHGDTKFYQYQEYWQWMVYSPFQVPVEFTPRRLIWMMNQVYHSHEPQFFATFFRYAIELWVLDEIIWEKWEKFIEWSEQLPWSLWNYGDAGSSNHYDFQDFLFRTATGIWWLERWRNFHTHIFAPMSSFKDQNYYYEFKLWDNDTLELHNTRTWEVDIVFYPEDCKHLLKWMLHQCAHWHGRTSKNQILSLVKYYYCDKYQQDKRELPEGR